MGLAQKLLCPLLLGYDWLGFHEVLGPALGQKMAHDGDTTNKGTHKEGLAGEKPNPETEDLDLCDVVGEGRFWDEQAREPTFHHAYDSGIANQDAEVLCLELMTTSPHFEVRDGILYHIK